MARIKISILFFLLLAFLFFCSMDVEATSKLYEPSFDAEVIANNSYTGSTSNYHFYIGTDGILFNGKNYVSYASGTAVFSFDTGTICSFSGSLSSWSKYDYLMISALPNFTAALNYTDNGLALFQSSNFVVKPYILFNGIKYYCADNNSHRFTQFPSVNRYSISVGADVECIVSFNSENISEDIIRSFFGTADINITLEPWDFNIFGVRYVSTGDSAIIDSVQDSGNSIVTVIQNFASGISSQLTTWKNDLSSQMRSWQSALDAKLDEVVQALGRDYDASGAESTNTELSGSLDSINSAEGTVMTDAKVDVGNYDTASVFNFAPAVISSLSLITTFANSFFRASGDLTTSLTVLFALVFISAVVGFLRFVK